MHDPLLGQLFDGYQIQQLLGRGGMARVYRATDQTLHRDVALKVLQDGTTQQLGGAERFLREARTLASLQHPAIVQIYNVGQSQGMSYIVQELLPGPALDDELKQLHAQGRHMEPAEVQRIIGRLASALDYAHQRGVIHRDLKPANVLRNQHGEAVLVDFGIAKAANEGQKLTQTGLVLGTPAYLAPEQCTGDPDLTHAVDIYALGIILYELLAGRVPFDDPSALAVAMAHVNTPPPPIRAARPDLSSAVEGVVLRALAKDPADRYPTAGALAADLERAWTAPAVVAPAVGGIHAASTTVNPALPPRTPAAARHDTPTNANPALNLPAAAPASSGGMARWAILGAVLLALVSGWLLFGRDGDADPVADETDARPTTESSLPSGGDGEGDGVPAEPTPVPAQGGDDAPPEPTRAPDPTTAAPIPSTPGEVFDAMDAVLASAAANGLVDPKAAEEISKKIADVEKKINEEQGKGKDDDDDDDDKGRDLMKEVDKIGEEIGKAQEKGQIDGNVAAQLYELLALVQL